MTTQLDRPNIILILADDMGFSDIGCYGSEINTPNIDSLARDGLRFSQMYNAAVCSPTRAALLTGLNPHQAGMGDMAEATHVDLPGDPPAYAGYLNRNCVTVAEVLKSRGYRTLMSGKWHVGGHFNPARRETWSLGRRATSHASAAGVRSVFRHVAWGGLVLQSHHANAGRRADPDR